SASWSGDVVARWDDLREQISAGVNIAMSGLPNWTHDIGGFAVEARYTNEDPDHVAEWRELNLRWFQFGAFSPIFRSHGEYPFREIFNIAPEGSEVYESMVKYDRLRYRLMPYIYALAGDTYHRDGTIMRGLVMDFEADREVWDINDQYMFGPSFLVSPVHEFGARERRLYLPAGTDWYDFHTGERRAGGAWVDVPAPLGDMPLFVRAGAVIPTGPDIQHTGENPDGPVTLLVYAGADGAFSLYEDDGLSYDYESGAWSRLPITYDDTTRTVTIGAIEGNYRAGETREFRVVFIEDEGAAAALAEEPDAVVTYSGKAVTITAQ
ncbi:MAG: TIM-barrel domain-containing protein, partial [Henriciella sp.]|uniref:glycoside hydrolase family 31 protein n=1 Tax=Henriciella sp. TaxID=1968823 RepID=UPI003C72ED6A